MAMKQTPLKRGKPRRRSAAEQAMARTWHRLVCAGRACVKSGEPAGRWGHHLVPKGWLRNNGLEAHIWDLENGCPVTEHVHANHESGARPITRDELREAGLWDRAVAWAKKLDATYFPDPVHQPVLSRLEREYPED